MMLKFHSLDGKRRKLVGGDGGGSGCETESETQWHLPFLHSTFLIIQRPPKQKSSDHRLIIKFRMALLDEIHEQRSEKKAFIVEKWRRKNMEKRRRQATDILAYVFLFFLLSLTWTFKEIFVFKNF